VKVIESIVRTIRLSCKFNPDVQQSPHCILWPDREGQWASIMPRLQQEMPELFVLGDYNPEQRTGPAIWLRCVVYLFQKEDTDPALTQSTLADSFACIDNCNHLPVIYLPGISRQDLRAVEACPDALKPLAELQYRGTIWSQLSAKDWTILAFLKSEQGGLGLDVAMDKEAKKAMRLALSSFIHEEVEMLRDKRLDKNFFNNLLSGGDPIRDILQWINSPEKFKAGLDEIQWSAFAQVFKSQLGFDPVEMGVLKAAENLAGQKGQWKNVWERFCEAPGRYPGIPEKIRRCRPPKPSLMWYAASRDFAGWPQWNDEQENNLRKALLKLNQMPDHEAGKAILNLEKSHGFRRELVWAELGQAQLAQALEDLSIMAENTENSLTAGSIEDLASGYAAWGWKVDWAMLQALSKVRNHENLEALFTAIRSIYLPWAEDSARHLQKIWWEKYAQGNVQEEQSAFSECYVFIDGLRFDCAMHLVSILEEKGMSVSRKLTWSALPSVTATGKPAVSPVAGLISNIDSQADRFEPLPSHKFKKILTDNNWTICRKNEPLPAPADLEYKKLWVEFGDIDHEGHEWGCKFPANINSLLKEIRDRIWRLIDLGWNNVRVVTDHGWLLLPGGLPKIDLHRALTTTKWSRCAEIKSGADTYENLYPWYWNPEKYVALADGISCFRINDEYSHGGLSLQECLLMELTVFGDNASSPETKLVMTDAVWKGLRCTVAVEGSFEGFSLDVRKNPGDAASSIVLNVKPLKKSGSASVVVEDEEMESRQAYIVLVDESGELVFQQETVVGG